MFEFFKKTGHKHIYRRPLYVKNYKYGGGTEGIRYLYQGNLT